MRKKAATDFHMGVLLQEQREREDRQHHTARDGHPRDGLLILELLLGSSAHSLLVRLLMTIDSTVF